MSTTLQPEYLFRIAPTPSGYLHSGNAYSFLLTEKLAKKYNGRILLRIDDRDAEHMRPEFVSDIFESLSWLGIKCAEGPENEKDFEQNWSQRHRLSYYNEVIEKLIIVADVFACNCSRKQLKEKNCTCYEKRIPLDTPDTALRIGVPMHTEIAFRDELRGGIVIDLDEDVGSFIIRRRDRVQAYQLTSVVDDLFFGVNYIVRGTDLLPSTAAQIFLAQKMEAYEFHKMKFVHHDLVTDDKGVKLSKSDGALSLKSMRENGGSPEAIRAKFEEWFVQTIGPDRL
ncbi:MAG TPA: glutamate--tRNA ligase family protein [Bacteroidia bacterium]|nr:glutamate--tRNA ligase family protein [Bacteroidia bacterium]